MFEGANKLACLFLFVLIPVGDTISTQFDDRNAMMLFEYQVILSMVILFECGIRKRLGQWVIPSIIFGPREFQRS
jgi:hypothetical protein